MMPKQLVLDPKVLKQNYKNNITRYYHIDKSLTLLEATTLALKVLKAVMEEKISASNIQVATITKEKGYKILAETDLVDLVAALP